MWSFWRAFKIDNVLKEVVTETCVTTSMVFIILLGAAMLTSGFRAFGGEELVRDFLQDLPGGFWTQFIVVMAVIFLLGFFLDFIEIAVVVVPIIAPILLIYEFFFHKKSFTIFIVCLFLPNHCHLGFQQSKLN